jgi:hypothetical protein
MNDLTHMDPEERRAMTEEPLDAEWTTKTLENIQRLAQEGGYDALRLVRECTAAALRDVRSGRAIAEAADMSTSDGLGAGPCMDVDDFAATVTGGKESADDWRLLAKSRLMVIEELADQLVGAERQRDHRPFEAAINEIAQATEGSAADLAQVVYAQLDKLGVSYDAH